MSTQSRVSRGVPTGGQFSTTAREEAAVMLATSQRKRERRAARTVRGIVIPRDAAYAVGRFNPNGPAGYRAKDFPDAPMRETRAEAETDWLEATERQAQVKEALAPALGMNRVEAEKHVRGLIDAAAADGDPQRVDRIASLASGLGWKGVAYVRGYPSGGGNPECAASAYLPTKAAATRTAEYAWGRIVEAERAAQQAAQQAAQSR